MILPTESGIYLIGFRRRRPAIICIDGKAPFLGVNNVVDAYDLRALNFSVVDNELYVGEHLMVAKHKLDWENYGIR
jgi:hypothetical protein